MSYSRRCGPSHDELVAGLRTGHALTLGRDLVDGFSLSSADSSIAVFDTPRLVSGGKNGDGYPDLLAVVRSGGAIFSAIVEVKRTPGDLLRSSMQYFNYLGCSSSFFIAVPSDIIHIAVSEIRYPFGQMSVKGVINANTGDIVVLPMVQKYDTSRCVSFVATTMASKRYLDDPVRYGFRVIGYSDGGSADYMDIDGMLVRRTYSPIVRSEADKRYPRDEYFDKYVGRYLR